MLDNLLNAMEYLRQGGWVMVPLAICSLLMWALILDRLVVFGRYGRSELDMLTVVKVVRNEPFDCRLVGLKGELLGRFLSARFGDPETDRHVLRQQRETLRGVLRERLALIAVLASIAPLLGLLGTVLGMIRTFEVISIFGTGNARAMAGGISMALITTQAGLIVAIPGLFISGWLLRRARRLENALDEFCQRIDRMLRVHREPEKLEAEAV